MALPRRRPAYRRRLRPFLPNAAVHPRGREGLKWGNPPHSPIAGVSAGQQDSSRWDGRKFSGQVDPLVSATATAGDVFPKLPIGRSPAITRAE